MTHTPWGWSSHAYAYGDGVTFHETPSHGGFHVAPELNARIPASFRAATFNQQGERGWYEEDHDWSIVAIIFPERFKAEDVALAHKLAAMRFSFPCATNELADAYERYMAEKAAA